KPGKTSKADKADKADKAAAARPAKKDNKYGWSKIPLYLALSLMVLLIFSLPGCTCVLQPMTLSMKPQKNEQPSGTPSKITCTDIAQHYSQFVIP
ncbi:hypothetical protein PSTT_01954, partial [Puccinia striiformis]